MGRIVYLTWKTDYICGRLAMCSQHLFPLLPKYLSWTTYPSLSCCKVRSCGIKNVGCNGTTDLRPSNVFPYSFSFQLAGMDAMPVGQI